MKFDDYAQTLRDVVSLRADDVLALDVESTGLKPFNGDVIRGISLAYRDRSVYIPFSHPDSDNMPARPVAEALERCRALRVGHHVKFDAKYTRQIGVPWPTQYRDTMITDWLLDENGRHGLKAIAARTWGSEEKAEQDALKALQKGETKAEAYKRFRAAGFSVDEAKAQSETGRIKGKTWATFTYDDIADYAAKDTELTLRLYRHQLTLPEYTRIKPAIQRHHDVEGVVFRMEHLGVQVDVERIERTKERYLAEMAEIQAEFGDVCLDSPKQLAQLIYEDWGLPVTETTATGAPSTAKLALELLQGAHPGLDRILLYRQRGKAVSTYFDALLEGVDPGGRIHTTLNTTGTTTGRFSSSGPSLQNIPRDGTNSDVRDVFIAAPGYELWSFDQSQAELRIAASIAGEESMIETFESGADIYQTNADTLFNCDDHCPRNEKGRCEIHGQPSKTVTLASQYMIGARKLARKLLEGTGRLPTECKFWLVEHEVRKAQRLRKCNRCDACAAKELLDNYWGSVPFLQMINRQLITAAETLRYIPLHEPGRFRRYPSPAECKARQLIDWPKPYTALNSVVQGGGAEITKSWLLASEAPLADLGARLVLTVHDSVVVELVPGTKELVHKVLQATLDDSIPPGWVRIPIDAKRGV